LSGYVASLLNRPAAGTPMTNADIAREIAELLGIGEHVSDCGAGPDPIEALLDKYYPATAAGEKGEEKRE
jgi:hypothetical protein